MPEEPDPSRGARLAGTLLVLCGIIGIATGALPLAASVARMAGCHPGLGPLDWAGHGARATGLGVEWAALSSACGTLLGGLLVAAGLGWRRRRPWAPLVTLLYAISGLVVNGTDLTIFALAARPGPVRTALLILDSLAFALPILCLLALLRWRQGKEGRMVEE